MSGGAPGAKRKKDSVTIDFSSKDDDPELIKQALTMTMPNNLKGFILAIDANKREAFYKAVMSQKNSDRVLKIFMEEIDIIKTVEDRMKNGGQKQFV